MLVVRLRLSDLSIDCETSRAVVLLREYQIIKIKLSVYEGKPFECNLCLNIIGEINEELKMLSLVFEFNTIYHSEMFHFEDIICLV